MYVCMYVCMYEFMYVGPQIFVLHSDMRNIKHVYIYASMRVHASAQTLGIHRHAYGCMCTQLLHVCVCVCVCVRVCVVAMCCIGRILSLFLLLQPSNVLKDASENCPHEAPNTNDVDFPWLHSTITMGFYLSCQRGVGFMLRGSALGDWACHKPLS